MNMQVNEAMADVSVEQLEAMSRGEALPTETASVEQDVSAPSGQTEEQVAAAKQETEAKAKNPDSDKEVNFAKLRTKLEAQEREVQRLAEENKRLAERQYTAELPPDHAQKVAEVDARITGIAAKFQEGEITFDEMQERNRAAQAEREQLLAASIKAQIAKEMKEQQDQEVAKRAAQEAEATKKTWEQTCDSFIAKKPDSVDYAADQAKLKDLNTYVKALAADADNENKPLEWFLEEAHALVKAKHGIAGKTTAAAPPKEQEQPKQNAPINTLSDIPGGALPSKTAVEAMKEVGGAALLNHFLASPDKIDDYLAQLGNA